MTCTYIYKIEANLNLNQIHQIQLSIVLLKAVNVQTKQTNPGLFTERASFISHLNIIVKNTN